MGFISIPYDSKNAETINIPMYVKGFPTITMSENHSITDHMDDKGDYLGPDLSETTT